jgi:excisionase family DNA binding protein
MNEKLLYRVREVAEHLSLSRSKTYELIRSGSVRAVRIDGSLRVRGVDLKEYVDSLTEAA